MITCPLCNKEFKIITNSHLKNSHNKTMGEFLNLFPGFKLISDDISLKHKQHIKKTCTENRDRRIQKYLENPKFCPCGNIIPYDKKNQTHCCHTCANQENTNHSPITKNKIKIGVRKNLEINGKLTSQRITFCKMCNKEIYGSFNKHCSSECRTKSMVIHGRNIGLRYGRVNAEKQNRRSIPEIKLFELLSSLYSCKHNVIMFNGWDADIIIDDLKLAILWNGVWHYSKVTKRHQLLQVQNRDRLKLKEIKNFGYNYLVVKDYNNKMTPQLAFDIIQDCILKNQFNCTIF